MAPHPYDTLSVCNELLLLAATEGIMDFLAVLGRCRQVQALRLFGQRDFAGVV